MKATHFSSQEREVPPSTRRKLFKFCSAPSSFVLHSVFLKDELEQDSLESVSRWEKEKSFPEGLL